MQAHTESALRAAIEKNGSAYHAALDEIHPGRGEKGKMLTTIFLCKAAFFINLCQNPDLEDGPEDLRRRGTGGTSDHAELGTRICQLLHAAGGGDLMETV